MKTFLGWLCISIALAISIYANYYCSFGCQGIYGQIFNPLSSIGIVFYVLGTIILFSSGSKTNQSIEIEGGEDVKAENIAR